MPLSFGADMDTFQELAGRTGMKLALTMYSESNQNSRRQAALNVV